MLTLAMPQSDPAGDTNRSASRTSPVARAELGPEDAVLERNRCGEFAVRHDVKNETQMSPRGRCRCLSGTRTMAVLA